jgi:anti-anti-sigma regulatory factor
LSDPDDESVMVDLSGVTSPDLATIDALTRLELVARRTGRPLMLRNASEQLCELLTFAGLADVVRLASDLPVGLEGKPEEREQPRVEEVRDMGDPTG